MLLGRTVEQRRIDDLLAAAREATSAALVVVGEPGIGKTALLEYAAGTADDFRILRARGVESEAELPFAALFELCRPILDRLEHLEPQQADVLRATFGIGDVEGATPFAIGAGTLSLLATAAEEQPLLLLVDDAHWLDRGSADAIAFAVRRLRADAVAALFATRPGEGRPFSGRDLPELELEGLDPGSAAALLERAADGIDAESQQELLELAGGNPLALLELPRQRGATAAGAPARVGKHLERAFAARAEAVPDATRRALVVAAADSTADLGVIRAALEHLGVSLDALEDAERAGLVTLDGPALQFRHPLVRSALYHAAEPAERRRAHAAVAAALGEDDRSAWHLAAAAVGPDARAAAALERAAAAASGRSGFAAAAAAYERAARLSDTREERVRRLAAAADAAWLGGRTPHALALLEEALAHAGDPRERGDLLHTRGTIEHFVGEPARAHRTLEEASALLVDADRRKACLSLVAAVGSSLMAGEIERAVSLSERACSIVDPEQPDQQLLTFSRGASLLMAGRPEEGLPFLRRAADAFADDRLLAENPRHLTWAALAAFWLGDAALMTAKASAAVEWARDHAAVATLAFAARLLARAQLITGNWRAARASLAESLDAARISGQATQEADTLSTLAWLDAAQGREDDCRAHVARGLEIAEQRNLQWRNGLLRALLLLELGRGVDSRSPGLAQVRRSLAERPLLRDTPANSTVPDLVEALVRLGNTAGAEELLAPFADEAERLGQPFPRAVALRCRALLADESSYESFFERSLELHAVDRDVFAAARTRLAYGERLRRCGRRTDAREELREGLAVFDRLDAAPWAERARAELRATGERVRARDPVAPDELTPQELQIAMLAAEGKTNREVGAQLFLSAKTIEWHLGHVYRKLGVSSRGALASALGSGAVKA